MPNFGVSFFIRTFIVSLLALALFSASPLISVPTAQAETKKETALKKCAAKRDGCYNRCEARYGTDGDAVNRCGVRTCDFQYGNCRKDAGGLTIR